MINKIIYYNSYLALCKYIFLFCSWRDIYLQELSLESIRATYHHGVCDRNIIFISICI